MSLEGCHRELFDLYERPETLPFQGIRTFSSSGTCWARQEWLTDGACIRKTVRRFG